MRGRAPRPASASCSTREPRSCRGSRGRDSYLFYADWLTVRRLSRCTNPVFQFQKRPFPYTDLNAGNGKCVGELMLRPVNQNRRPELVEDRPAPCDGANEQQDG